MKLSRLFAAFSAAMLVAGSAAAGTYTDTDSVSFTLTDTADVTFAYNYDELLYYTFDQGSKAGGRVAAISSLVWTDVYGNQTSIDATLDGSADSGSFTVSGLGAGTYTASLTGTWVYQGEFGTTATYLSGGNASLGYAVTPVPEPAEIALMLTGLGLVGGAVRRRRAVDMR
ncbi:PEP-CTERM sorting domain-containing protein [Parasulfuritortus cantonensis]|nr:PEP-CTERM sorting domain-containing protein [Parasulfuritortus cantonensis]